MKAYGQQKYQQGRRDALMKLSQEIAQTLGRIPQPTNQTVSLSETDIQDEQLLDLPIEFLGLDNPAPRILKREGLTTIRMLIEKSRYDLVAYRGLGVCTASAIQRKLKERNLTLRDG